MNKPDIKQLSRDSMYPRGLGRVRETESGIAVTRAVLSYRETVAV